MSSEYIDEWMSSEYSINLDHKMILSCSSIGSKATFFVLKLFGYIFFKFFFHNSMSEIKFKTILFEETVF